MVRTGNNYSSDIDGGRGPVPPGESTKVKNKGIKRPEKMMSSIAGVWGKCGPLTKQKHFTHQWKEQNYSILPRLFVNTSVWNAVAVFIIIIIIILCSTG